MSETPYVENDDEDEEKRYIEGQVIFVNGCNIVDVYDLPQRTCMEKLGSWVI